MLIFIPFAFKQVANKVFTAMVTDFIFILLMSLKPIIDNSYLPVDLSLID